MFDPVVNTGIRLHRKGWQERVLESEEPLWRCEFCGRSFKTAEASKKHMEKEMRLLEGLSEIKEIEARKKRVAEACLKRLKR